MQAWQMEDIGEPHDVLRLVDIDGPRPTSGEVLLQVDAVGLKFPDLLQIRGGYQVKPKMPHIPGGEIAGTVLEVGDGVDSVSPGDRVLWMGIGGLAEQVCAPAQECFAIPEEMSSPQAAAMLTNYGTTVFALEDRRTRESRDGPFSGGRCCVRLPKG